MKKYILGAGVLILGVGAILTYLYLPGNKSELRGDIISKTNQLKELKNTEMSSVANSGSQLPSELTLGPIQVTAFPGKKIFPSVFIYRGDLGSIIL